MGRWLPQTTGRHMNRKLRARHRFLPISPLMGEMPGRAEGVAPRRVRNAPPISASSPPTSASSCPRTDFQASGNGYGSARSACRNRCATR
ncbi:hypothetical protein GFL96_10270 [Rhizobium leguminosarum bv. viciae]|nr:hypothetical protein [Rhizobium leguminosarum bv. viciae]